MIRRMRNKIISLLLYYDLKVEIQQEPTYFLYKYYPYKNKKVGFNVEFIKWK